MNPNIKSGYISHKQYYDVVKLTQLVSVDLLVKNNGRYLLGKRKNKPAQGFLFVPGGKVYNNETIHQGIRRIAKEEIGLSDFDYTPIGVYEHIYDDNYCDDQFGTHYIVHAFEIKTNADIDITRFNQQHESVHWLSSSEIKEDNRVHLFNKYYFLPNAPNSVMLASKN